MECGYNFTLAVKTDGTLYGTGENTNGQLGLNDTANRNSFTEISSGWLHDAYEGLPQFSGGAIHSMAINSSNILNAAGDGAYGQLGIGTNDGPYDPSDLDQFAETDDSIDDPDNNTSDGIQDTWDFVVGGKYHSLALKIVIETITYNDDDEPQVWSLPTGGPSL